MLYLRLPVRVDAAGAVRGVRRVRRGAEGVRDAVAVGRARHEVAVLVRERRVPQQPALVAASAAP